MFQCRNGHKSEFCERSSPYQLPLSNTQSCTRTSAISLHVCGYGCEAWVDWFMICYRAFAAIVSKIHMLQYRPLIIPHNPIQTVQKPLLQEVQQASNKCIQLKTRELMKNNYELAQGLSKGGLSEGDHRVICSTRLRDLEACWTWAF